VYPPTEPDVVAVKELELQLVSTGSAIGTRQPEETATRHIARVVVVHKAAVYVVYRIDIALKETATLNTASPHCVKPRSRHCLTPVPYLTQTARRGVAQLWSADWRIGAQLSKQTTMTQS
jgi:hypothetical protein